MTVPGRPPADPAPGPSGDPAGPAAKAEPPDVLVRLVDRVRAAGWDPSARELADALWLAQVTAGRCADTAAAPSGGTGDGPPAAAGPPAAPHDPDTGTGREQPPRGPVAAGTGDAVSLYTPPSHDAPPARGFPVRAPAIGALAGLLGLQRALRPLRGYRMASMTPSGALLDEEATAERCAREGLLIPVLRPAGHRVTELQLLMDASPSSSVWQLTLERLRQVCERLGTFRDVQVHYLHPGPDGTVMAGTGPDPRRTRLRPADQHRDTTGRRLTLVVSDCAGELWRSGAAQRMLHRWAASSPVAVVQPLPPRLWDRAALPADPGTLVREPRLARGTRFLPDDVRAPAGAPPGAVAVPVLLPTERVLGGWARMLGGPGGTAMRGAAAWVRADHAPQPAGATGAAVLTPHARWRAFQADASPGAVELAVHLAAVPLHLPVMQLVQAALLPDTGPMELAEVLLGGLLERLPDLPDVPGPRYEFAPGVRDLLLRMLDRGAAELVLKYLSEYVSRRFGKGMRNFPALAVARLRGHEPDGPGPHGTAAVDEEETDEAREALFAHVSARVLRWYRPARPVPGRLDEAERLLGLWQDQRDGQLLREAELLAEAAFADAPDARSRLLLGRVLHARAGTPEARGHPGRARRLMLRAQRLLAGDAPETAVARGAVQHDLWRQDRTERAWLRAAGESLRGAGPIGGDPAAEAVRLLRLGRVHLDLARTEPAGAAPGLRAGEAVRELRAACDGLGRTGAPARRRAAALLDLVEALRLAGDADEAELLGLVGRAEEAAGGSDRLLLRCLRERARSHRAAGDPDAAAAAYEQAEQRAPRDSPVRCELLTEWGETLLAAPGGAARAVGILREALADVSVRAEELRWRVHLLLGSALLERYRAPGEAGGRSLPDLYEGAHLLEQAARRAPDGTTRARSWLALAGARREPPGAEARADGAEDAYGRALREAWAVQPAHTDTVVRALAGRADLHARHGRPRAALADHQELAALLARLARSGAQPYPDVARETARRIAALENPGDPDAAGR